jgi:hypothetical protein
MGDGRKVRLSLVLAWLAVMAAAIAAGTYAAARLTRIRYSDDPRLDRAARAIVTVRPVRKGSVAVQGAGGAVAVPMGLQFDRRRAVLLAVELERARRGVEAGADGRSASGAGKSARAAERPDDEAADAYVSAEEEVGNFLAVDGERAQPLLYALGWPWVGQDARRVSVPDFRSARAELPRPLASMSVQRVAQLIRQAQTAAAWPAAEQALKRSSGLNADEVSSLRAVLCRQAVVEAFGSEQGTKAAASALGKYADLAPAQAEAVLAMAGAIELVRAGAEAAPALKVMAKRQPELAAPVLKAALAAPVLKAATE